MMSRTKKNFFRLKINRNICHLQNGQLKKPNRLLPKLKIAHIFLTRLKNIESQNTLFCQKRFHTLYASEIVFLSEEKKCFYRNSLILKKMAEFHHLICTIAKNRFSVFNFPRLATNCCLIKVQLYSRRSGALMNLNCNVLPI